MSSAFDFMEGQGIEWISRVGGRAVRHVDLLVESDQGLMAVPVRPVKPWTKCYDDAGAVYATDRDNVRLAYSPDMFTKLRDSSESGQCYVYADLSQARSASRAFLALNHATLLDDGRKIDDKDMRSVKCHPWPQEPQQERASGGNRFQDEQDGRDHDDALGLSDNPDDLSDLEPVDLFGGGTAAGQALRAKAELGHKFGSVSAKLEKSAADLERSLAETAESVKSYGKMDCDGL